MSSSSSSCSCSATTNIDDRDSKGGWTAFHHAVNNRDLLKVKELLKVGADINATTTGACYMNNCYFPLGTTPLHIASYDGELEIVRLLVASGACVDARDEFGCSPICDAASEGHVSIVEFLAFKGADINKTNKDGFGYASMHVAAKYGHDTPTEILCAFGADQNILTKQRRTPLNIAVRSNHVKTVRLLLELNSDTTGSDRHGWNVFQTSCEEIRQLLLEHSKKSEVEREQLRQETLARIRYQLSIRLMRYAQEEIVGICFAFASLELPPYVLLWIIDWLPNYHLLSHRKKIDLIHSVRNSIWKLKDQTFREVRMK